MPRDRAQTERLIERALSELAEYFTSTHDEVFCKELNSIVDVPDTGDSLADYADVKRQISKFAKTADLYAYAKDPATPS